MKAATAIAGMTICCLAAGAAAEITRPVARPASLTVPVAQPAPPVASTAVVAVPVKAPVARDPNVGSVTNLPLPRYVSLKTGEGNARRGPGLTHRIDWVFTRAGMPLRITAEFEHWRRVEDLEGFGGWVHYSLLSGVRSAMVQQDMAEFRTLPDPGAPVSFHAEYGVIGKLLTCEADWCRMVIDGQRGWVRTAALWGVDPGEHVE
jgi:SH3-like domain-containing protein